MPHLIIEHSREISLQSGFEELVRELHFTFAKLKTVKLEAVKTRTMASDHVLVGDGSKREFIFLRVLLLSGRSVEIKEEFTQVLTEILKKHIYQEICCLSIEIVELQHYYTER